MPGPVSESNPGPAPGSPYVPSHFYKKGPKMCFCGHHEGYHDDGGCCLHVETCGCTGMPEDRRTPMVDM